MGRTKDSWQRTYAVSLSSRYDITGLANIGSMIRKGLALLVRGIGFFHTSEFIDDNRVKF